MADHAEDINIEFIAGDFPKLLDSMAQAVERIVSISTSLRTFSRVDVVAQTVSDLHEGLDSTLLMLKYRLKANEKRPAIALIKDYGPIPELFCFPGQLNQVFMNILANAIDALDEAAQSSSYAELEAHPQQIAIATAYDGAKKAIEICIRDNGPGLAEELQPRIFDRTFTTKAIGQGTGLGLAIARQIVEKHGGCIGVKSQLGKGTCFCIHLPADGLEQYCARPELRCDGA